MVCVGIFISRIAVQQHFHHIFAVPSSRLSCVCFISMSILWQVLQPRNTNLYVCYMHVSSHHIIYLPFETMLRICSHSLILCLLNGTAFDYLYIILFRHFTSVIKGSSNLPAVVLLHVCSVG